MKIMYVTFTVQVSDDEYAYRGSQGEAKVRIQVTRAILESIDPGNLFVGAMQAALVEYDAPPEKEPE